jgi:hypothetical protein
MNSRQRFGVESKHGVVLSTYPRNQTFSKSKQKEITRSWLRQVEKELCREGASRERCVVDRYAAAIGTEG